MRSDQTREPGAAGREGSPLEVLAAFLRLGLTSFGGPVAHLGYFRDELVVRRRWLDEAEYADLVALCQFLPGPASSQVGFALGLHRAGPLGALAAWTGFTFPSAAAMFAFAYAAAAVSGPLGLALVHGLKLVAVAIVAQAVLGIARTLAPDARRSAIAVAATAMVLLAGGGLAQIGAILIGAAAGLALCRSGASPQAGALRFKISRRAATISFVAFFGILLGGPALAAATGWRSLAVFDAFYRSGALVFGGGHVVLPLLQARVVDPGWISSDTFLAGYGAAQAVPGPLFTFAAYLGAVLGPAPNGLPGAMIAVAGVFLPGMLILVAVLPFWDALRQGPAVQAALRGTNAAVVGILAAALYDPIWTSAIATPADFAVALCGLVALVSWRAPPWSVVVGVVALNLALTMMS
ncbi:chromate efflux transporter [soil metagenome]